MSTLTPNPSQKSIRNTSVPGPASTQSVKFARRTSSGRYVSLSRDEINLSGDLSCDYTNYSGHIPPTPDSQPMDEPIKAQSVDMKTEEQYVSSSLFTGGFNSATREHVMVKVIDSAVSHPQMAGAKSSSSCAMPACDGKVMADERGNDIHPCECRFKICCDCYLDALKETGNCPGCKEPYRVAGDHEEEGPADFSKPALPEPTKSSLVRSQTGKDFDHNSWLFETQGTYGYGNAYWPKGGAGYGGDDDDDDDDGEDGGMERADGMPEMLEKPWKPLTRVIPMPAAIIQPYRLLMLVRFVALFFFLAWRIQHPNVEAPWLWGMSVVCEVWFAFSWILDQAPKLHPINRTTDLKVSL